MNDLFPEDPQLALFAQRFSSPTFDPTTVRPVISIKSQMKPMMLNVVPTVEEPQVAQVQESRPSPPAVNSPRVPAALLPISNSPKRPFEDADNELAQPRKIVRGESPLKGAAGRRLDAARRNLARASESGFNMPVAPPPAPLPREITFLLSIIPGAKHYLDTTRFNPQKLVAILQATNLPSTAPPQVHTPAITVAAQPTPMNQPMNQPMNPWGAPPLRGMGGTFIEV